MKCPKCGLEMFNRPIIINGKRVDNYECTNKQCENKPKKKTP